VGLAATARSEQLSPTAAAILDERLQDLAGRMEASKAADAADRDLEHSLARLIRDPRELGTALKERARKPVVPPGMPIGEDDWFAAPPPSVSLR
jgi:hypothetical protein